MRRARPVAEDEYAIKTIIAMYSTLLYLHSYFRWLVLLILIVAIIRAYRGWKSQQPFLPFDNKVRYTTATIAQLQLILGLWLYCISPIVSYFLNNFQEGIHQREIRFFGMEHSLIMVLAVAIITVGSIRAKRKGSDAEKFKTMAIWFTIGLLAILSSIPWSFSPLTSRPLFRPL